MLCLGLLCFVENKSQYFLTNGSIRLSRLINNIILLINGIIRTINRKSINEPIILIHGSWLGARPGPGGRRPPTGAQKLYTYSVLGGRTRAPQTPPHPPLMSASGFPIYRLFKKILIK